MYATSPLRAAIVSATMLVVAACASDSSVGPGPVPQGAIVIAAITNDVFERDALTLHATVKDVDGREIPNAAIQWSTVDTTMAQVTPAGIVTAVKPGTARITARSGNLTSTVNLSVKRISVLTVSVLAVPDTLASGDVAVIGVDVRGEGERRVLGRVVTFASSNPAVALIDASGRVRGVGPGTATISATADGVAGHRTVRVDAEPAILSLRELSGERLPKLVAADTVRWNGVREYHEVYLESGRLQLSGGSTPRYDTEIHYAEYAVTIEGGVQRRTLRLAWDDRDRGLVHYDVRGDLRLTSEVVWPLSHDATGIANGFSMRYRIAGTNDVLWLFFRREPK